MAKLSELIASMEDLANSTTPGGATTVDVKEVEAGMGTNNPAEDNNEDGGKEASEAACEVDAGETDFVTPEIQDAIDEGVATMIDIEEIRKGQVTLEDFHQQVAAYVNRNEACPRSLAEAIKVATRNYPAALIGPNMPALEDYDAPTGRMTVSLELMAQLKAGATTAGSAVVAALQKMLEAIHNIYNAFRANVPAMREQLASIKQRIQSGNVPEGQQIGIRFLSAVSVAGRMAGADAKGIDDLTKAADAVMVKWPAALLNMVNKLNENDNEQTLDWGRQSDALMNSIRTVMSQTFTGYKQVSEERFESPDLPGGRVIGIELGWDKLQGESVRGLLSLRNLVRVSLDRSDAPVEGGMYTVPSRNELLNQITKLEQLISVISNQRELTGDIENAMKNFDNNTIGILKARILQAGLDANFPFSGYLITVVKSYLKFFEQIASSTSDIKALPGA